MIEEKTKTISLTREKLYIFLRSKLDVYFPELQENNKELLANCLDISIKYFNYLDSILANSIDGDVNDVSIIIERLVEIINENIDKKTTKERNCLSKLSDVLKNDKKIEGKNLYTKCTSYLCKYYQEKILNIKQNDQMIFKKPFISKYAYKIYTNEQIFLSYSYDDSLLTIAIFVYFLEKGRYVYIDWMHNGEIEDGILLKEILIREIYNSNEFMLLRSPTSEFNDNKSLRQWCAWEIGAWESKNNNKRKYFFDTIPNKKNERRNMMYDGFKEIYKMN